MNFLLGGVVMLVILWIYSSWKKARNFNRAKRELIAEIENIRRIMAQTEFSPTQRPRDVKVSKAVKVKAKSKVKGKKSK